jgi:pyroglutamyl-peptidase
MTPAPTFLLLTAFSLLGSAVRAQGPSTKPPAIVVSGFEAFGGRAQNASWILAGAIAKAFPQEVCAVQIPVVWGAPLTAIYNTQPLPDVWVAFGEGTAEFQIEIHAHNQRGRYPDNHQAQPATPDIVSRAAPVLKQRAEVAGLAAALTQAGFPTHVSQNAGRYLCEEMLYSLLHAQAQHPEALRLVLFIHVPALGQSVQISPANGGTPAVQQKVDAVWLQAFGKQLFASLRALGLLTHPAAAKQR